MILLYIYINYIAPPELVFSSPYISFLGAYSIHWPISGIYIWYQIFNVRVVTWGCFKDILSFNELIYIS